MFTKVLDELSEKTEYSREWEELSMSQNRKAFQENSSNSCWQILSTA